MIEIRYSFDGMHDLRITGHADHSDNGNDIVCAGVSAITYTLLGFLANTDANPSTFVDRGDCIIMCYDTDPIHTAFEMALIGYMQIAKAYPDNVTVHI